jgi:hypothetical protein
VGEVGERKGSLQRVLPEMHGPPNLGEPRIPHKENSLSGVLWIVQNVLHGRAFP